MVNIQTEGFPDGPGPAPPPPTPLTLIHDISQHLRYYVQDKLKQNYEQLLFHWKEYSNVVDVVVVVVVESCCVSIICTVTAPVLQCSSVNLPSTGSSSALNITNNKTVSARHVDMMDVEADEKITVPSSH